MLTALAGGVGAARFLRGLVDVVDPASVTVVVNTGDDDEFHGLWVSPDLDSVTYTLAGAHNPETGWGLAGETFAAIDALARYGVDTWFRLGDRDLATHLFRTEKLPRGRDADRHDRARSRPPGASSSRLLPMTDDRVATRITARTDSAGTEPAGAGSGATEELAMQDWFVRRRAEPPVVAVRFDGARRGATGARCARRARAGRDDHRVPEQPRDLDRSDPRGARHPRRARSPAATAWWVSARSSAGAR